jgi:hypothetical protein
LPQSRQAFKRSRFAHCKCRDEKKPARRPVFLFGADYFAGTAAAAAEAAESAAEAADEAAAAASEAAEAAAPAAEAAASAATTVAGAAAGASTTGAATGASSFLLQAAKATTSREAISRDFFMGFSLNEFKSTLTILR